MNCAGAVPLLNLQAAPVKIAVGSLVWVEDPDVSWIDGEVLEVNDEEIKISCTNEKMVCALCIGYFYDNKNPLPCLKM